jgi:glycosyltransferase involved in cell wall biosynthesis
MTPLVSIVVATRNAQPLLAGLMESIDSLPRACRIACEVIVIDAASIDGTRDWLGRVTSADRVPPVSWISEPDGGIAEAWNKGVALARGEWVVFLGADDRVADGPSFSAALAALHSTVVTVTAVAFPIVVFDPLTDRGVVCKPALGRANALFLQVNTLPHQGVFHRRAVWKRYGDFDTRFTVAADYEFLLRLITRGGEVRLSDGPPPVRMAAGGLSKRSPGLVLREFRFAQSLHGVHGVRWRWWAAWLKATARRGLRTVLGVVACRRPVPVTGGR